MAVDFEFPLGTKAKDRSFIAEEVSKAFGSRGENVTCEIWSTSDGRGIVVRLRQCEGIPSAFILPLEEQWKRPGMIERMVHDAIANLDDPGMIERKLVSQKRVI